jgi:hypothetical protein
LNEVEEQYEGYLSKECSMKWIATTNFLKEVIKAQTKSKIKSTKKEDILQTKLTDD